MRRLLQLATLSLVALLVFAPSAWAQGQEVTVRMEDNFFDPASITVEPGTTVTWVQSGNNPHTTTSYDGLWDSGMIEGGSGGTFSFTFEEPGTYDYFCIPHESMGMIGSVTVTSGTATASPASTATGTATATASPTATALSDTGGPPIAPLSITLAASLALMGTGVVALALLRRRGTS
ncbi:MAG TPA: plastocyanin/azurin family copper-binding protein [Rubrobacteraceae bacterium]|nr:plastocyanin/azurin family copper-binding protein [Rubrobacteraceae bacterium]